MSEDLQSKLCRVLEMPDDRWNICGDDIVRIVADLYRCACIVSGGTDGLDAEADEGSGVTPAHYVKVLREACEPADAAMETRRALMGAAR